MKDRKSNQIVTDGMTAPSRDAQARGDQHPCSATDGVRESGGRNPQSGRRGGAKVEGAAKARGLATRRRTAAEWQRPPR